MINSCQSTLEKKKEDEIKTTVWRRISDWFRNFWWIEPKTGKTKFKKKSLKSQKENSPLYCMYTALNPVLQLSSHNKIIRRSLSFSYILLKHVFHFKIQSDQHENMNSEIY